MEMKMDSFNPQDATSPSGGSIRRFYTSGQRKNYESVTVVNISRTSDIVGNHHDEGTKELKMLYHQDCPERRETRSVQMIKREDGFLPAWVAISNKGSDIELGGDKK
jgi:hypothetical protein